MQDCAKEITSLIEPSQPLGYRLLMFSRDHTSLVFEAKAVACKQKVGYLVRSIESMSETITEVPIETLSVKFAPTKDALMFLIRDVYNLNYLRPPTVVLKPPHCHDHEFGGDDGSSQVNFGTKFGDLHQKEYNSVNECVLRETVAALTLMHVPKELERISGF